VGNVIDRAESAAKRNTDAVLGAGIDVVYPNDPRRLAEPIREALGARKSLATLRSNIAMSAPDQASSPARIPGVRISESAGSEACCHRGARAGRTADRPPTEVQSAVRSTHNESPEPQTASHIAGRASLVPRKKDLPVAGRPRIRLTTITCSGRVKTKDPSESFAALFELGSKGKIRQLPGENLVKSF
jgi:hypothetical protein